MRGINEDQTPMPVITKHIQARASWREYDCITLLGLSKCHFNRLGQRFGKQAWHSGRSERIQKQTRVLANQYDSARMPRDNWYQGRKILTFPDTTGN